MCLFFDYLKFQCNLAENGDTIYIYIYISLENRGVYYKIIWVIYISYVRNNRYSKYKFRKCS